MLALAALAGTVACAEPKPCDTADASFVVERQSAVRILVVLRTRGRQAGNVSYEASWTHPGEAGTPIAVAVVGTRNDPLSHDGFVGRFVAEARDEDARVEIRVQRLDEADAVLEGEFHAEAEAAKGCSIELDISPE